MRANDNVSLLDNLDKMPTDILMQLFASLTLQQFASMRLVNKKLSISAKDNELWQHKFIQHFHHAYRKLDLNTISNWYDEFSTTYQNEYPDEKSKKLISLVKEKRFEELKEILLFDDLNIADKNGERLSSWICEAKNQPFMDYCYQLGEKFAKDNFDDDNGKKYCILIYAVCFNQIDYIHNLVPQIVNVHDYAPALFKFAIRHKHIDVIHALLADGFDPNLTQDIENELTGFLFGNKHTPLHLSAIIGDLDITQALLTHGVNIDATTTPWNDTPLACAANGGHIEIVNTLIAFGANIDISHLFGTTPLDYAKRHGHNEIALAITKQRLRNYLVKTDQRHNDDYKTYSIYEFNLSLFGACSAKQKKEAGYALARVYLDEKNESLDAHEKALSQGELKSLHDDLKSLTDTIASKRNTKRY